MLLVSGFHPFAGEPSCWDLHRAFLHIAFLNLWTVKISLHLFVGSQSFSSLSLLGILSVLCPPDSSHSQIHTKGTSISPSYFLDPGLLEFLGASKLWLYLCMPCQRNIDGWGEGHSEEELHLCAVHTSTFPLLCGFRNNQSRVIPVVSGRMQCLIIPIQPMTLEELSNLPFLCMERH